MGEAKLPSLKLGICVCLLLWITEVRGHRGGVFATENYPAVRALENALAKLVDAMGDDDSNGGSLGTVILQGIHKYKAIMLRTQHTLCREVWPGLCEEEAQQGQPNWKRASRQEDDQDDEEDQSSASDDEIDESSDSEDESERDFEEAVPDREKNFRAKCGGGIELPNEVCLCPLDLVGPRCSLRRTTACEVKLLKPSCNISPEVKAQFDERLAGDPPCLMYEFNSDLTIDFEFELFCRLRGNPQPIPRELAESEYADRAQLPNRGFPIFAIRENPENESDTYVSSVDLEIELELRPVNWFLPFSDFTQLSSVDVSVEQLTQGEVIKFSKTFPRELATAESGYAVGGRLYTEARLKKKRYISRRCLRCTKRIFMEIVGRESRAVAASNPFPVHFVILSGLGVILPAILGGYVFWRTRLRIKA